MSNGNFVISKEEKKKIREQNTAQNPQTVQTPIICKPAKQTVSLETPYQQNLSVQSPQEKWYAGSQPTTMEVYGRIGQIFQTDTQQAYEMYNAFRNLQNTPGNPFYNPYNKVTNRAVSNLAAYGIDTSNINDDWYKQNGYLTQYLNYDGTTNTPSKPGSKASNAEKAAYEYYQVWKAEEGTKKAEKQWKALQEEIYGWANMYGRNYTDEEILNKIDWSKYSELTSMDDPLKNSMQPNEYNRVIGYSKDALQGVLWAARNPNADGTYGTGSTEVDMVYSAMGQGNRYVENPELRAMLDPKNEAYSPYAVGSTMEKARIYFNRNYFNQDWLDKNKDMKYSQDETQKAMYNSVEAAEEYTQRLEKQLSMMKDEINVYLQYAKDPQQIIDLIYSNNDYKDLFDLDKTISKGELDETVLKATTRAVNYRRADVEKTIRDACEAKKNANLPSQDTDDTLEILTGDRPETNTTNEALEAQKVANLNGAGLSIMRYGTDAEKQAYIASNGGVVGAYIDILSNAIINIPKSIDMVTDVCSDLLKLDFGGAMVSAQYRLMEDQRKRAIYEQAGYMGQLADLSEKIQNGIALTAEEENIYSDLSERNRVLNHEIMEAQQYLDMHADEVRQAKQNNSRTAENIALGSYLTGTEKAMEEYGRSVVENRTKWLRNVDSSMLEDYELDDKYAIYADDLNKAKAVLDTHKGETNVEVYGNAINIITNGEFDGVSDYDLLSEDEYNLLDGEERGRVDELYNRASELYNFINGLIEEGKDVRDPEYIEDIYRIATGVSEVESSYNFMSAEEREKVDELVNKAIDTFYIGNPTADIKAANDKLWEIRGIKETRGKIADFEENATGDGNYDSSKMPWNGYNDAEDVDGVYYFANNPDVSPLFKMNANMMTDKQRETFNKYYNSGDKEKAYEYYNLIKPDLEKNRIEYKQDVWKDAASGDFGFLVGLASVPLNIVAGIQGATAIVASFFGNEKAKDGSGYIYDIQRGTDTIRNTRMELFDEYLVKQFGEGAKGVGKFFGGVYYSILDNLMTMGMAGGFAGAKNVSQGMVQILMSSEAASSAMLQNLDSGMDVTEAAIRAIGTGLIEAATEKYSLEALLNMDFDSMKSFAKQIVPFLAKNTITEASEEGASEILDLIMDVAVSAIAGHENEIETKIKNLMAENPDMTRTQAESMVWGEWFGNTLTAMGSGAVSGFAMSGGRTILNALGFEKTGIKNRNSVDSIINDALLFGANSDVAALAEELQEKKTSGKRVSNFDIGRLKTGTDIAIVGESRHSDLDNMLKTASRLDEDTEPYKMANDMEEKIARGESISNYEIGQLAYALYGDKALISETKEEEQTETVPETIEAPLGEITENDTDPELTKELTMLFQSATNGDNQAQGAVNAATVMASVVGKDQAVAAGTKLVTDVSNGDAHTAAITFAGLLRAAATVAKTNAESVANSVADAAAKAATATEAGTATGTETIDVAPASVANTQPVNPVKAAIDTVKKVISYASLTNGEANAALKDIARKVANHEEVTQQDLSDLVTAAGTDMNGENGAQLEAQLQNSVNDIMIAMEGNRIIAERGVNPSVTKAEQNVLSAKNAYAAAVAQQQKAQANAEAAANNLKAAEAEYDPSPDRQETAATLEQAANRMAGAVTEKNQKDQIVASTAQNVADAEKEAERITTTEMNNIRQESAANVQQMREQQAAAAEQAMVEAENAKIEAEQKQAEADKASGKAWEQNRDEVIEKILNDEYLEEGERREARRAELTERANMIREGNINMAGMMNNAEGLLAVGILGRQLGVEVAFTDDPEILPEGASGKYKDGVVYLNKNMIQEGKMTVGQAVLEIAMHEFTHYMEGTKAYSKYSQTVLDFLFQGNEARMRAAIDSKIADYQEKFGRTLTEDGAKAEIVADFARTRLNDRDVVNRFINDGIAGKIRNALHNINQAIKNFRLTGVERETAEYLRKTERLFQKMIEESARSSSHPDGDQFSIAQLAESAGLDFDQNTLEIRTPDGTLVDGVNNRITPEMLNNTPIGMMIGLAENGLANKKGKSVLAHTISKETAQAQRQMFADLANMAAQYKDSNLVWEIASSTLFSAMKANSDPQYSTTVDFGTICAKTQEIINVMSRVMLEKGRGLTREEVLKVYNETAKADLTVPCPVCYVFSRWMGVPSLLGQMSGYQKRFVKTNADGSINVKATAKLANDYVKAALEKYGNKEGIDKAKTSIMNRLKTQEKNRTDALKVLSSEDATKEQKDAAQKKHDKAIATLDSLTNDLGEVEAFNWVTQALCKQARKGKQVYNVLDEKGNYVIDPDFELTPDDVLFDLRRTGDFAKYTKNWSYRNTRGAGMGKAIMPYSGETVGDIIYGTTRKMASANPFLTQDPKTAAKGINDAIIRAVKQNLIGGQRLQSTSDFRPEWGLDYLMTFLELQAIGSKVQMYTKVAEAVPLLASMGADINLSIMGKGKGWHVDENGNYVLDFSDVTGMNYETAKALKDQHSNVQMILVGMNDTHIRLALADSDIDFVIPWHASGNSKDTLASLVSAASTGQEQLETSSDYTDTQSDAPSDNQTPEQKKLWDLRMKILQGKKINAEEREIIYTDEYLAPLYDRFNVSGVDADCYKVKLGQDQAKQIFPYEYWDKALTKADADENGRRFVDYCQHFGITPRFSGAVKHNEDGTFEVTGNFAGAVYDENGNITGYDPDQMYKGYWKVLIDRPMYDNDGNYRDQQVVDVTKARIGSIENGKLVNSDMPLTTSAMYGPNYSDKEKTAVDNAVAAIEEHSDLKAGRFSDGGTSLTDVEQIAQTDSDYMDAVDRGDMEAAQDLVDKAAEDSGYTVKVYHGTANSGRFNLFDPSKLNNSKLSSQIGQGFYFTNNKDAAKEYTKQSDINGNMKAGKNPYLFEGYLRIQNPIEITEDSRNLSYETIRNIIANGNKDWFFESGIAQDCQNEDINGQKYTKAEISAMSKDEKIDLYTQYLLKYGDKYALQHMVDAYKYGDQGLLLEAMKKYTGNDGIHWHMKEGLDQFVAFDSSQFKDASPVTYDDDGNVIPLSERFDTENEDIRYSDGGISLADLGNTEYMKPFAEQLHDFAPKETREKIFKTDSLLVGATPELLRQIGFPALPVVINQEHVGYALDGTYPKEKYRAGHTFKEEEFAKLPQKIADPVAITYDSNRPNNLVIYIDMINTEGDKVVTPVTIGEERNIGGKEYNTNSLRTVFEQENGAEMIASAIRKDSNNRHTLFYLNKEKALGMSLPHDIKAIVQNAPSGINHIINAPGSLVNTEIKDQTDSSQFKKWFKKSKVKNPDGSPMVVYHGTNEAFTAFDMSKGRSTMDIQGAFFSPWAEDSAGYGENVGAFYLSIKNPASEKEAYAALNMYKGQNEAGKKAREYLISKGYDGVINGVEGQPEEFIAFYPTQIKSATDNIGMFNGSNPDYRYSDGGTSLTDLDQQLVGSGVIAQEELDAFNGNLPGQPTTEGGSAQRQFGSQTAQTSDALHEEVKNYLYTHSDYTPDTNQAQINRAIDWVSGQASEADPDGYRAAVEEVMKPDFDYRSADGQARMLTVMGMAALKGDTATEMRIADAYNQQGTDIGRQLQARKLFRLMTPIGRRMTLQQEVARINQDYKNNNKDTEVHLSENTLRAAEMAQTEEEFQKVQRAAEKELAEQMPANWKDKLRTWRMLSMLANPRTHIRNLIGNWIFKPTVALKNAIGAGLESRFVKEGGERTKALKFTDDAKEFAAKDVEAMRDTLTGEAKYSPESRIEQEMKAFGQGKGLLSRTIGKGVQALADFNSDLLEKEDWIFLNRHYQNALASYMTANKLTSADMTGKTLEKARNYAILEAQKATYRDANKVSSWLNSASREGGVKGFLVDAVLPFKKTPANILRRGIEYSPVGLIKSLATAKRSVDLYAAWEANGMKGTMPKGAKSLTQALDGIASGLTGTAIAALGALAYSLGAIKLSLGGEPDDELAEGRGSQEYSIELFGHSFTIDWAAPVCMPFFVGASLYKSLVEDEKADFGAVVDSLMQITEPVFNLSMLDGVNSLLSSIKYSSNENKLPVGDLLQKIGANYVGSYAPSILGAAARTIDTTRRKNFVPSGASLSIWQSMLEQVQNKIPFLSMKNIPYRNVWGEAEESGRVEAFLENFVLPGYINQMNESKLDTELQRLYDAGQDSVIPKAAGKTVGGAKLNAEQYDQYVVTRGQTAKTLLEDLIERPEYVALTNDNPEAQAQLINDVWEYSNAVARHELFPESKMDNWISKAYATGEPIDAIFEREETKAQNAYVSSTNKELFTSIDTQDADAVSACLEGLKQAGKDEKSIRTTVMNHYRDLYKQAFINEDEDAMNAIKYGLMFLDLGKYSIKNDVFDGWAKDAVKAQEEKDGLR